jgi:hypothetical protein
MIGLTRCSKQRRHSINVHADGHQTRFAMKWANFPNLRMRPSKPAQGRGRVQIRIRRAFIASGAEVLTSSEIYNWTHPRSRLEDKTLPAGTYNRTSRTIAVMCERLSPYPSTGRPVLWRYKSG